MPLYEYECPGCGRSFEKLARASAADDGVICPHCSGRHSTRKLSTFAISGRAASAGSSTVTLPGSGSL